MSVKVKMTISCGCGYLPPSLKEAQDHAEKMDHVLTMHGQIGPVAKLSGARLQREVAK